MAKRHPNYRLVKIHRSYEVQEAAKVLDVHKNTVRAWLKNGLPTSDDKRPTLILGSNLKAFLKARRAGKRQPCRPGEIYCLRCRAPKTPAGRMVDYRPITAMLGNLTAICPDCDSIMNQRVGMARLEQFCGKIEVTFSQAVPLLIDSSQPSLNSDLEQGKSHHDKTQCK